MSQKIAKVHICRGKDHNPHNIEYPLADDSLKRETREDDCQITVWETG